MVLANAYYFEPSDPKPSIRIPSQLAPSVLDEVRQAVGHYSSITSNRRSCRRRMPEFSLDLACLFVVASWLLAIRPVIWCVQCCPSSVRPRNGESPWRSTFWNTLVPCRPASWDLCATLSSYFSSDLSSPFGDLEVADSPFPSIETRPRHERFFDSNHQKDWSWSC
jgi:hypothetical protein